jgi:hypothetical protein
MPEVVTIAPVGPPNRLRVPKMRVCDERLGVKRDEPSDGSVTEDAVA